MDRDLEWEEYLKKIRQKLKNIEKKKAQIARKKEVLKYMASHPKQGTLNDLMSINGSEAIGKAVLKLKIGIANDCSSCNKIDVHDILKCLYCNNSAYEITLENRNGIKKTN